MSNNGIQGLTMSTSALVGAYVAATVDGANSVVIGFGFLALSCVGVFNAFKNTGERDE